MSTYTFTLHILGPDLESYADALYEAGCDDALFGMQHGVQFGEFDREAPSLQAAVGGALRAVESAVPGARVVHVLPGDLVGVSGIAERIGRSRESVRLLAGGRRGPGTFPAPVEVVEGRPIYAWSQVVRWLREYDATSVTAAMHDDAEFIAALNGALARRRAKLLHESPPAKTRSQVRELVGS